MRAGRYGHRAVGVVAAVTIVLSGCSDAKPAELALPSQPEPEATELDVLVMERGCASGRPADGRMSVDDVDVTPSEVRLRVSVEPLGGTQECPGNPWTPLTVQLGAEIGDRRIIDANSSPPAELEVVDLGFGELLKRPMEQSLDLLRAWQPPATYTLVALAECYCPATRYRLEVVEGDVVQRAAADGGSVEEGALKPEVTPSLQELRARILGEPSSVVELAVEDDGTLVYVVLDPDLETEEDYVVFTVEDVAVG